MKKKLSYKGLLFLLMAMIIAGCTSKGISISPPEATSVVVWKGFHFDWTYNHRLKEFRSSVFPSVTCSSLSACTGGVQITSQRGEGPDMGSAKHFFSIVSETDDDITFFTVPGNRRVINGAENVTESLAHQQSLTIPIDAQGYDRYYVFFNGFHLQKNPATASEAENLISYELQITNPTFVGVSGATSLPLVIDGRLKMATTTAEADPGNSLDYLLNLEYLVVAVNDEAFGAYESLSQTNDFDWEKPTLDALRGNPQPQDEEIQFSDVGSVPLVDALSPASFTGNSGLMTGITGFSIDITTEGRPVRPSQHLLSWYMALSNEGRTVEDRSGNPFTQSYQAQADLFFKNWRVGMRRGTIAPFYDDFSYGAEGNASMSLSVGKLEFSDALQHHDTVNSVDCNLSGTVNHPLGATSATPSTRSFSYSPTSLACP